MKKTFRKIITFSLCLVMIASSAMMMTSCSIGGSKNTDMTTIELQMNDYRGGVMRTYEVRNAFLDLMEDMKQNNDKLRADNPNSFWGSEGYQDFVTNLLAQDIIFDTENITEEEASWDEVLEEIANTDNNFTEEDGDEYTLKNGVTITRNEKDDYSITVDDDNYGDSMFTGETSYRILYDCDKDWCKSVKTIQLTASKAVGLPTITEELYEYARLDNDTFAVQTSKERLVVVYEPVTEEEPDPDIRDRKIKEIYYSKLVLDGTRTTFDAYIPLEESNAELGTFNKANVEYNNVMRMEFPFVNNDGDLADRYGANDSMFFLSNVSSINSDWVFEDKSLQQAIIYKDGNLVVTTYNKLSKKYERFIYSRGDADESQIPALEAMVDIKNLVGVVEIEMPEKGGDGIIDETIASYQPPVTTTTTTTTYIEEPPVEDESKSDDGSETETKEEPADESGEGEKGEDTPATTSAPDTNSGAEVATTTTAPPDDGKGEDKGGSE